MCTLPESRFRDVTKLCLDWSTGLVLETKTTTSPHLIEEFEEKVSKIRIKIAKCPAIQVRIMVRINLLNSIISWYFFTSFYTFFSSNREELDHNYKVVHIILVEEVEVEFARIAHEEDSGINKSDGSPGGTAAKRPRKCSVSKHDRACGTCGTSTVFKFRL